MSTITAHELRGTARRVGFGDVLRAEWSKLWSVRSTWWTLAALVVLGAGLTTALCWGNADWLASGDADESPGSFITVGMTISQVCALVLGVLVVTSEYGSGMIRTTLAATPGRGRVIFAKSVVVAAVLMIAGTLTALLGYVGGNWFLDREGIGLSLEGDVLRAMYGSGLFLAGLGVLGVAVGFLVRHTAAAISVLLAQLFVVETLVMLIPGSFGDWVAKVMPGNAGLQVASPVSFIPDMFDPWVAFAVFLAEVAALWTTAWWLLEKRDA